VLVVFGPSTAFNPLLPQSVIDAALVRDRDAASAEWLSVWRSDISDFIDRELVEMAVDGGVTARPQRAGFYCQAFCDPSGGRGDAFTAAVAHEEGGGQRVVLDCLYERRSPFDPSSVVADIARLLRSYNLSEVTGDRYAAGRVVDGFAKENITYNQSGCEKSELYLDCLPLFTTARARLVDNERLLHQLCGLERRTSRAGRDRVDHGPGGAYDLANSACGALVLATTEVTDWHRMAIGDRRREAAEAAALTRGSDPAPVTLDDVIAARETQRRVTAAAVIKQQRDALAEGVRMRAAAAHAALLRVAGGDRRMIF
jgi:hypothetical protein